MNRINKIVIRMYFHKNLINLHVARVLGTPCIRHFLPTHYMHLFHVYFVVEFNQYITCDHSNKICSNSTPRFSIQIRNIYTVRLFSSI